MNTERWQRLQSIFLDAIDRPEAGRMAFVEEACGGDNDLKAEVLAMIEKDGSSSSIIDQGWAAMPLGGADADQAALLSQSFEPYELKQSLGEGGMGVVYLAEHVENKKLVAIKILTDANWSPARMERFAAEQRILAQLEHPCIAQLHHADVLPDGTPWFAMEYIGGKPNGEDSGAKALSIDAYCRERKYAVADRLKLFRSVCEAVQHAHGLRIVHRDLKPSNILVTPDGKPKLLDFGIAKALDELDGGTTLTVPGLRIMTLAYASPEQVRGLPAVLSMDIYALGVILYELIAGRHPFDFSHCTTKEVEEKIVNENPPKPSIAARAVIDAPAASRSQWSDLDALCLKAMHKESVRRYITVEALIRDIDQYLAGKPLDARPDSLGYRTSKFVKRNLKSVIAGGVAVLVIAGIVVGYSVRLARARDAAVEEAARTQRLDNFLLDLLQNGDSEIGPSENMPVKDMVNRGVKETGALDHDPAIQADLYETFGDVYSSWGKAEQAKPLLDLALERRKSFYGADSKQVAESLLHLGMWHAGQDQMADAERLIREALTIQHRRLPADDPATARTLTALGLVLERRGDQNQAINVLNQAIAIQTKKAESNTDLSASLTLLANAHYYLGHYDTANSLNLKVLDLDKQLHGARHPDIADDLINLGNIQFDRQHYAEAENYFRQALDITQSWYGKAHPSTADNANYLAKALVAEGKLNEAETLLQGSLTTLNAAGGDTPRVSMAMALNQLGTIAQRRSNWPEAEADFKKSAQIYETVYGKDHSSTIGALASLADVYLDEKRYAEAERELRDVIPRFGRSPSADPLRLGAAHVALGEALGFEKHYKDAEAEILAGYDMILKQAGPSDSRVQAARSDLVAVYEALHEPVKAAKFRAEFAANEAQGNGK